MVKVRVRVRVTFKSLESLESLISLKNYMEA